ncbi:MAG: serpin family protein [Lachnospiraceae bacterium]|nr:serpin family protein [Lachnospiraceae bacterium]
MKKDVKHGTKVKINGICKIAAAIMLAGTMTACAAAEEKEMDEATRISAQNRDNGDGTATSVIAEYPTADNDNHTLMQGINSFAYDMSGYLEATGGNYFFSPYSLGAALTILDNAAEGETKSQIESLFDIADIQDWNMQMSLYMNKEQQEQAFITSANSLWIDRQYTLSDRGYESYLPLVEFYYDAQIYQADFKNDPDGTKELINQWVSENTNGMIKNFKQNINSDICLSIINAVYFYGEWSWPFREEATGQETFYGKSKETTVDMMRNGAIHLSYYESDGIRGLSMPYGDKNMVMNILLPSKDAGKPVEEIFGNMTEDEKNQFLTNLMNSKTSYIQSIWLPKFSMDYSVDGLIDILNEMGMVNAFDWRLADFPGIGDEIYVVDASHVAKLEVDEHGSRAAAVTEFNTATGSTLTTEEPIEFIVDQPFIFFIQDKETGVILFMGQINDFEDTVSSEEVMVDCRVVDSADVELLLAKIDGRAGDVYRLSTKDIDIITESGEALTDGEIESGSLIEISFDGNIEETFPGHLCGVTEIRVLDKGGFDNLCSLYLDVLEDLWQVDSALNSDITMIGVDLSQTRLSPTEQSALAWRFRELHGVEIVQGTWQELVEQGYIDGEALYWENGCLFSITEKEMEGEYSLNIVTFDAEKWRSGLGAYCFVDCTSVQSALGKWGEYQIGAEAIS